METANCKKCKFYIQQNWFFRLLFGERCKWMPNRKVTATGTFIWPRECKVVKKECPYEK